MGCAGDAGEVSMVSSFRIEGDGDREPYHIDG